MLLRVIHNIPTFPTRVASSADVLWRERALVPQVKDKLAPALLWLDLGEKVLRCANVTRDCLNGVAILLGGTLLYA
jgi:hypothetical protein